MIDRRTLRQLTTRALLFAVVSSVFFVSSAFAGDRYAVVVAVSQFDDRDVDSLDYVETDARTIIRTLRELGFIVSAFCEPTEGVSNPQEPTRANVLAALQKFLPETVKEDDSVFFYVSTHGQALEDAQTQEKRTYLLTKDTKLKKRAWVDPSTALSAREIREATSKLKTKNVFLAFDACQSGGTRGGGYGKFLDILRLEDDFQVATLASCATNQSSYPIEPVGGEKISLFTYLLNEGLKGYADENSDGEISTDELATYVRDGVTSVRDLLVSRKKDLAPDSDANDQQTPYVVAPENLSPFVFANIEPRKRDDAINEIAEQIATRLHASAQKRKTGKLSLFFNASVNTRECDFGRSRDAILTFRDSFSEKLKKYIASKLKDVDITLEFVSKDALNENTPEFRCEFMRSTSDDERAYIFFGRLSGLSDADGTDARAYVANIKIAFDAEVDACLNKAIARNASTDEARVWIEVVKPDGRVEKRTPVEIDDVLWVPLDVGEKYRIVYELSKKSNVGVRALVDGRNTIGQYETYVAEKFVVLGLESDQPMETKEEPNAPSVQTERPGLVEEFRPRVSLDEARFWVAPKPGRYAISGFYERSDDGSKGDANSTYEAFVVASNDDEASEQSAQVGLIQVAFYDLRKTRSGKSDVRTVPSKKEPVTLTRIRGFEIKPRQEPFAYVSLRYASSKTLERLQRDPGAFYAEMDNSVDIRPSEKTDEEKKAREDFIYY